MSNFYLCDICACKGTLEDGTLITCSWFEVTHKKPICDSQEPKDVCEFWEPKEIRR